MLIQFEDQPAETPVVVFPPLLSDDDLAGVVVMTTNWVRSHVREIPGYKRPDSNFPQFNGTAGQL